MSSRVANFFYTLSKIFMNVYDRQENQRRYEEEKTLNESNFIRNYALQDRQNLLQGIASYRAMGNNEMASQLQAALADYDSIILEQNPQKRVQLYNDFRNRQATLSPGTVLNPTEVYQPLPFAPTVTRPGEPQAALPTQQPTIKPGLLGSQVEWPPSLLQPPSGQPTTQVTSSDFLRSLASMQPTGAAPSLQFPGAELNAPVIAANQQARAVNQPFGFQALAAAGPLMLEQNRLAQQQNLSRELAALSRGEKAGPSNYSQGFYERARSEGWMAPDGKSYDWAKVAASGFYTPEELQVIQKDSRSYLPSTQAAEEGKLPQGIVLAFGQLSDNLNSIRESYRSNNIPLPAQFSRASALLSTMFSKEAYDPAAVDAINQLIDEATVILGSKISAKEDDSLRKARQLRSEEATLERHKQVGIELQLLRGSVAYKKRNLTAEEQKLIDSYNALGTAPDPQQFDAWLTQNAMALADANVFAENTAFDRSFERIIQQTQATTNIQTAAEKTLLRTKADLAEEAAIKDAGRRVSELLLNKTIQQDLAKYSQGLNLETMQVQLGNALKQIEASGTVEQRNAALRQAQDQINQLELIGARAKIDSDARVQQSGLNLVELAAQLKGQLSNTLTTMEAQAGYNAQSDARQLANRLAEIAATQSGNLKNELTTIGAQLSSSLTQLERSSDLQARNTAASQAQAKIDEIDILIRRSELSENAADKQLARELITIREQASLNLNSQLTLQKSGADLNRLATNQQEANAIKTEGTKELGLLISKARQVFGADRQRQVITPEVLAMQQELIAVKDEVGLSKWQAKYLPLMDELRGTVAAQADVYARTERQGDILFQQKVVTDGEAIKWSNDMRSEFSKLFRDFGAAGAEIPANILQAFAEAGSVKDMAGQTAWNNKWGKTFGEFSASVGKAVASYTLKSQKELEKFSADLRAGERVETFVAERLNQLLTLSAKGAEAGYVLTEEERRAISALNAVDSPAEWTEWKKRHPVAVASLYENVGKAIAEDGNKKLQRAEDFEKEMTLLRDKLQTGQINLQGLIGESRAKLEDQLATARMRLQRTWQVEDIKNANDRDDAIRTLTWARENGLIADDREYQDRVRSVQNAFNLSMQNNAQAHAKEMAANDREFTASQNQIGRAFSERMQDKQERFAKWQITTSRLREDAQRAEDRINKLTDTQSERDFIVSREQRNQEYQTQRDLLMREWQLADESNKETFTLMIKQLDQAYNDAKIAEDREWQKKMVGINLDAQKQYASFSKSLNSDAEVASWQTKHLEMLSNRAIAAGRVGLPVPAIYKQAVEALSQVRDIAGQNAWVANYGVPMVTFAAQIGEAEKTYESDLESGQAAKNLAGNQLTRIDNALQSSPGITNDPIYNEAKSKLSAIISGPNNAAPAAMLSWMQQYGHIPLQVASAGLTARELSEQKISVLNNIQAIANNQVARLKNALDGAAEAGASTASFQRDINEAIATAQQILTSTNADQATALFKTLDPKITTLVTKVFELSGNTRRANDAALVASDRYWREEQAKLGRDHATMLQEKAQAFTASLQGASIDPIIDQLPYYLASVGKIGGEAGTGGNSIVSYKVVNGVVQDVELDLEALINDPKLKGAISESQATLLREKKIAVLAGLVVSLQKYENIKRESAVNSGADPVKLYQIQVEPAASMRINDLDKIRNAYIQLGYQIPQEVDVLYRTIGDLMLNQPSFENNAAIARAITSNPNLIATELNKIAELNRVRQVIDSLDPSSSLWGQLNDKWQAAAAAGQPMRIDSSFTQMLGSLKSRSEIRSSLLAIANSSNPFATMLEFKWVNPDGSISNNMPADVRQVLASADVDPATRNRLLNPQSMVTNNFKEARLKFSNVLESLGTEQAGFTQQFGNDIARLEKIIPETASAKDVEDYNKLRSSLYSYWASSQLRDKNVNLLKNVLSLSADSGIPLSEAEVAGIVGAADPSVAVTAMSRIVSASLTKAQEQTDLAGKTQSLASFRKNVADPIKDYLFSIPEDQLSDNERALREQIAQLTIIDYGDEKTSNDIVTSALMAAKANPALPEVIAKVHQQNAAIDKTRFDAMKAELARLQGDELTNKSQQYEKLVQTIDGSPAAFSYITALKEQGLIDASQYESLAKHHKTLAPLYAADLEQSQKEALLAVMDVQKFYAPNLIANNNKIILPGTPEFAALREKMVTDLWNAARQIGLGNEDIIDMQGYLGKALEAHARALAADAAGENAAEQRRIAEHNMRMAQGQLSLQRSVIGLQRDQLALEQLRQKRAAGGALDETDLSKIRVIQSQYNTAIENYQNELSTLRAIQSSLKLEMQNANCFIGGINIGSTPGNTPQAIECRNLLTESSQTSAKLAKTQSQLSALVNEANKTVGSLLGVTFSIDETNRSPEQKASAADAMSGAYYSAIQKSPALRDQLVKAVSAYLAATKVINSYTTTPANAADQQKQNVELAKQNKIQQDATAAILSLTGAVTKEDEKTITMADRSTFLFWALERLPGLINIQVANPATNQPATAKPPAAPAKPSYTPSNTKAPGYSTALAWKDILTFEQVNTILNIANDPAKIKQFLGTRPTLAGRPLTENELKDIAAYYRVSGVDLAKLKK